MSHASDSQKTDYTTEFLEIKVKRSTNNVDSDDKIIYFNKRRIYHVNSDFDPDDIRKVIKE